jgi:hypothetical protein
MKIKCLHENEKRSRLVFYAFYFHLSPFNYFYTINLNPISFNDSQTKNLKIDQSH